MKQYAPRLNHGFIHYLFRFVHPLFRRKMTHEDKFVGVCWGSVNLTVIFHKINLILCVCRRLSVRCELALRALH